MLFFFSSKLELTAKWNDSGILCQLGKCFVGMYIMAKFSKQRLKQPAEH